MYSSPFQLRGESGTFMTCSKVPAMLDRTFRHAS
jgi:hypothetical protein